MSNTTVRKLMGSQAYVLLYKSKEVPGTDFTSKYIINSGNHKRRKTVKSSLTPTASISNLTSGATCGVKLPTMTILPSASIPPNSDIGGSGDHGGLGTGETTSQPHVPVDSSKWGKSGASFESGIFPGDFSEDDKGGHGGIGSPVNPIDAHGSPADSRGGNCGAATDNICSPLLFPEVTVRHSRTNTTFTLITITFDTILIYFYFFMQFCLCAKYSL